MGWKYADLDSDGVMDKMCVCGHPVDEHHVVYWPLGMTADECEVYGFNETGGMKPTWRAGFFERVAPWHPAVYTRDYAGKVDLSKTVYPSQRWRNFLKRLPVLRGPWYVDHCHHFEEEVG